LNEKGKKKKKKKKGGEGGGIIEILRCHGNASLKKEKKKGEEKSGEKKGGISIASQLQRGNPLYSPLRKRGGEKRKGKRKKKNERAQVPLIRFYKKGEGKEKGKNTRGRNKGHTMRL